ncbi:hypothetical protein AB0912_24515 [Streptomyces sp. NPDC007084]|uniref:hypothetical protein n=1 Tax=Streptomyces sp. NPDC007084 TaxID=3154313 RepID=UPI00345469C7
MGALRRIRSRTARGRTLAALTLGAAGVFGATACEPGGGLSPATVAYTTDQTATRQLERQNVDVRWLTCTANYGNAGKGYTPGKSPAPTENTVASVDCRGQTGDGRDIVVKGKVTRAVNGACVRGDLTGTVGGRQKFHVSGLGNCDTAGNPTPPATYRPPNGPAPTVTVTVTKTMWCKGDPTCWPTQGK